MTEKECESSDLEWFEQREYTPFTEETWLTTWRPKELLAIISRGHDVLPPKEFFSERKLRLYATACCYRIQKHFEEYEWKLVEACELFADGVGNYEHLKEQAEYAIRFDSRRPAASAAIDAVGSQRRDSDPKGCWVYQKNAERVAHECALQAAKIYPSTGRLTEKSKETQRELAAQADLLREVFGNPFRPVAFLPAWWTDTALSLARQMYASREFSAMPILADALQDAGCDNADILDHCRGPGPHIRGCWVIDLVLGKE
jgi:hypothetical protein